MVKDITQNKKFRICLLRYNTTHGDNILRYEDDQNTL